MGKRRGSGRGYCGLTEQRASELCEWTILRRDFKEWKPLEKSRSAKRSAEQSVEKRRKRGRVKSENDKRLGGRPQNKAN